MLLAQYFEFIGLMDHLYELGLLDTGEYFVVGVCLAESDTITPDAYLKGKVIVDQLLIRKYNVVDVFDIIYTYILIHYDSFSSLKEHVILCQFGFVLNYL